jgi:hypothetical protein
MWRPHTRIVGTNRQPKLKKPESQASQDIPKVNAEQRVQQGPRSEGQSKVREPGFWLTAVAGKCSTPLVNYLIKTFIGEGSPV